MDKVILSSNKSQHERVLRTCQQLPMFAFRRQLTPPLNTCSPKELFLFLLETCFGEYYILVPVLKDFLMPD